MFWQAICFKWALLSCGFVSLCLHWLNVGEAALCERWASRTCISCKLWERQRTASTDVAAVKGFPSRKSLWKYFLCYTLLGLLSTCLGCLLSCKNQLDQGQACAYEPSDEMVPFLVSAAAFPQWGWKYHIPFCTLILIHKWRSLAAFERFYYWQVLLYLLLWPAIYAS